jgi:hypothetical protein
MFHLSEISLTDDYALHAIGVAEGALPQAGARFGPAAEFLTVDDQWLTCHRVGLVLMDGTKPTVTILGEPELSYEERKALIEAIRGKLAKDEITIVEKTALPMWMHVIHVERQD